MSQGTTKSNNGNEKLEELDLLLKEKYDRERLEEWKKVMPMPEEKTINNSKLFRLTSLIVAAVSVATLIGFFALSSSSPSKLADDYLASTVIASLDEQNARGENKTVLDAATLNFQKAVTDLKADADNTSESLKLLAPLANSKNKYQAEALWFSALANVKIGNHKQASIELKKLITLSTYKKEQATKLLKELNK